MKFHALFIFFPLFFFSCGPNAAEKRKLDSIRTDSIRKDSLSRNFVEICSDSICLTLPRHFIPVYDLNPEATLQFSDSENEEYLIVIAEDKKSFLDSIPMMDYYDATLGADGNYRKYWEENMKEHLDTMYSVDRSEFSSRVSRIKLLHFMGGVPDVPEPVAYSMAFVEGKTKMYVITAWTLDSQKSQHEAELNYALTSFREQ